MSVRARSLGGDATRDWAQLGVRLRALVARLAADRELGLFLGIAVSGLALRLVFLPDKPFHHDESIHAWLSWLFSRDGNYQYDPVYHGPVQYYLIALMYVLFGASDFTARLEPVLVGTIAVFLPFFLRRQLGLVAAATAAVLLAATPPFLYFSRFTREDMPVGMLTLALVVAVFRFLDRPRPWHPALIFGILAASFATKESTYITTFIGGTFFIAALAAQLALARRRGEPLRDTQIIAAIRSVGGGAWIWAACSFAIVFTVLFTVFFTNPQGLRDGATKSLTYWLSQHEVNRGDQPWFYYLVVIPAYVWPVVFLAIIGAVVAIRRATLLGTFLIWFSLLSLVIYSWAGERMPWLVVHPLLPIVLLAGLGMQTLWQNRRRATALAGLAVTAVGAVYMGYAAVRLAYLHPADPRELLVFTQTGAEVTDVRDRILELDRQISAQTGRHISLDVDTSDGAAFPWAWYLRDIKDVAYNDFTGGAVKPRPADAIIISDANRQAVGSSLDDYVGEPFSLRVWWVVDYRASPGDWARWLLRREPWNELGSLNFRFYVRRGLEAEPGSAGAAS